MKNRGMKMIYLILPLIAGIAITLQGAFSSKMGNEVGFFETIVIIHFFGLVAAIIIYFFTPDKNISFITNIKPLYILAGTLGVIIIYTISKSISVNGVLITIMISVLIQMVSSKIIEHYGLFGVEQVPLDLKQVGAIVLMAIGVFLYQLK